MNERIRELADEAAKFSAIMALPTGEAGDTLFVEKFAELIIRECAQVCRDQPNVFAMKLDRENCAIAIEEHFGVEE